MSSALLLLRPPRRRRPPGARIRRELQAILNDALISCDAWLGKIGGRLKELGLYDKTRIYVTAEHGFDEGQKSHADAPYVFLATNDRAVIRGGTRGDITPTILDRFGVDLSRYLPPLDGKSLLRDK
jgi:arylsulfatase A-like enzyme